MIEVITGPMFSGKTEELIKRIKKAERAGKHVSVVKPDISSRYSDEDNGIVSHNQQSKITAQKYADVWDILNLSFADIVAIDEAQFFSEDLFKVVLKLSDIGIKVIICGLDLDFKRTPFPTMAKLLCIAHKIDKLTSVCYKCFQDASYSQRITFNENVVLIGGDDIYYPACKNCYNGENASKSN